ncbi:MAG: dihydrofolate reductase family protein [Candidatus Delongbacteria bacterium]|nr:dihydrofolate reductase family protein [Candidatus Delongbacteria bacterium]
MLPKVIIHQALILNDWGDESNWDRRFEFRLRQLYHPDALLINLSGCGTTPVDRLRRDGEDGELMWDPRPYRNQPFLIIPDHQGVLEHHLDDLSEIPVRQSIVILVSAATRSSYLKELKHRNMNFVITGLDRINFQMAFEVLNHRFQITSIRSDGGTWLNQDLLDQGVVDEISLVIRSSPDQPQLSALLHPLNESFTLQLIDSEPVQDQALWVRYQVLNRRCRVVDGV